MKLSHFRVWGSAEVNGLLQVKVNYLCGEARQQAE